MKITLPALKKNSLLPLLCIVVLTSCNREEVLTEVIQQLEINTTPCDYTLASIGANTSAVINCTIDLGNETVILADNVNLDFDGGQIINGTVKFSGGKIDGRLLNSKLKLEGEVTLKEDNFFFYPTRWAITQGKTSDALALANRENINRAIQQVKAIGGTIFNVGEIDAYFDVRSNKVDRIYMTDRSITIPSNFHFKMSNSTFLRVQPNNFPAYALLTTMLSTNTKISGGHLVGDRYEHDYRPIVDIVGVQRNEHGWGFLLYVIGTHDSEIDNVTVSKATGDGVAFHGETLRQDDGTLIEGARETKNVIIKNSTITDCRRNNISILDGRFITIDNCTITDCGKGVQAVDRNGNKISSSAGTAPKYGIDMEAVRTRETNGDLRETALIENVTVKNSRFTGNEAGDIVLYTANSITIENNFFDKWVANKASHTNIVRNNTFTARESGLFAISVNSLIINGEELNYDYTIHDNTIVGYDVGIKVSGTGHEVARNNIKDCQIGIMLQSDLFNTNFHHNNISSTLGVSFGYKNFINAQNFGNVIISDETILVQNRPISLIDINDESTSPNIQISFKNSIFNNTSKNFKLHVRQGKNIKFEGIESNTVFEIFDSENIILLNNDTNKN